MWPTAMLLGILGAGVAVDPVKPTLVPAAIDEAIATFVPHWKPRRGELDGLIVGIDPAGGLSESDARACQECELVTAAYLYHYVLTAGGTPILTRVDDTRAAASGIDEIKRRTRVVGEGRCALAVSIRYLPSPGAGTVLAARPGGAAPAQSDAELAQCIRSAFEPELGRAGAAADSRPSLFGFIRDGQSESTGNLPVCEVRLVCPPDGYARHGRSWQRCQANARSLYDGIRRFGRENLNLPASPGASKMQGEAGVDACPVPGMITSTPKSRMGRLGRSIWPAGRLPDDKVDWFCRLVTRLSNTDRSLIHLVTSASAQDGVVILSGTTNAPSAVTGLTEALAAVGVDRVRNEIQTLPNRSRLDGKPFGACRVATALTFDRPSESGGLQTQLLFGEPVFLLDRLDGYYLLHAGDGYWGWVDAQAIQPMTDSEFDRYMGNARAAILQDVKQDGVLIPRGAQVPIVRADHDTVVILLPNGSTLTLPAAAVRTQESNPGAAAARVAAALDLVGSPYIFGGRSRLGLDCSGLITNVWVQAGDQAARDAWQQAFAGSLVATWWHRGGIRPGDQVFFIDTTGKIYHTGVAITATHLVHAVPPGVQIGSLKPGDRLYDARLDRDFFMAKRP